jgi:predicted transcriptional regulator
MGAKLRKMGRPPAGRDEEGRPVAVSKAYKPATLRLRPSSKAALDALALIQGRDRSSIVENALEQYIGKLPPADRDMIEQFKRRAAGNAVRKARE